MATTLKKGDFPESVHGLIGKNKTELLNIIARKDEVEKRLSEQVRKLTETVEHNRNAAAQYANDLKKDNDIIRQQSETIKQLQQKNDEINTEIDITNDKITQLKTENYKLHKHFNYLFIVMIFLLIVFVIRITL